MENIYFEREMNSNGEYLFDIGNIRTIIIENFVKNGYNVTEINDILLVNDKVEIQLSDEFIKDLIEIENYSLYDFLKLLDDQYNYVFNSN